MKENAGVDASDEELIAACRQGDEAAWSEIVARYQRLMYAIPRRAGLDEDAAAEVFQQVFTILVEKLDRIEQPSQLHAWLVTTAKRETWRLLRVRRGSHAGSRRASDEPVAEFDEQTALLADAAPLPDAVVLALEDQHRVRACMNRLEERCRHLLTLLFYEDEPPPYAEIARATGIKEGGIGPTRARCLQKLMRLLGEAGVVCIFSFVQHSVRCVEFASCALYGATML